MRILLFFLFLSSSNLSFSNSVTLAYFFPGQGSDERIFAKIKLDSSFKIIYIVYPIPKKGATLSEYAHEISKQIDTQQKYIFIGVSLGGMICSELADFLNPEKIIIISSAKCRKELPFRYRFQKVIPINKILPKGILKMGAQILQPIVEPDRKQNKDVFKSMLKSKSSTYYKRTIDMIVNWNRETINNKTLHIHGTRDHTIPIRNVKVNLTIAKGSHTMTLTRGEEMNILLQYIISSSK